MTTTQLPDNVMQLLDLVTDPKPQAIEDVNAAIAAVQYWADDISTTKDLQVTVALLQDEIGALQEAFDHLIDLIERDRH